MREIAIDYTPISGRQEMTINARDLHAFLAVGKDFSNWIKCRIQQFGFIENQDFVCIEDLSSPNLASSKSRQRRIKEYHLTIGMAKELSMVERTPKGKEARQYFIECERRLTDAYRLSGPEQKEEASNFLKDPNFFKNPENFPKLFEFFKNFTEFYQLLGFSKERSMFAANELLASFGIDLSPFLILPLETLLAIARNNNLMIDKDMLKQH